MNKTNITLGIAVLALIVAGMGLIGGGSSNQSVGGTRFPNGLSADSTSPSSGEVRGTTLTSTGAATLNSATITNQLTASGDIVADTTDFVVDVSADAVGVGTSTPQSIFHFEVAPTGDGSVATSTLIGGQQGTTTSRAALELKDNTGATKCAYIVGTSWVIEAGQCN